MSTRLSRTLAMCFRDRWFLLALWTMLWLIAAEIYKYCG
jgi:hypothetical protein